ncbi:MAG: MaoC/PaaZ C-terminal domain-containing protein [Gammaproteobacteria bacterium]
MATLDENPPMTPASKPLQVGDQLPPLRHSTDILESAIFSDWSGNHHRIHWDHEYARSEGLSHAIVNSGVLVAWVEQDVQKTYGGVAGLKKLDFRFQHPVPIGAAVCFGGEVKGASHERGILTLQIAIWIRGLEDSVHLTGNAVVELAQ